MAERRHRSKPKDAREGHLVPSQLEIEAQTRRTCSPSHLADTWCLRTTLDLGREKLSERGNQRTAARREKLTNERTQCENRTDSRPPRFLWDCRSGWETSDLSSWMSPARDTCQIPKLHEIKAWRDKLKSGKRELCLPQGCRVPELEHAPMFKSQMPTLMTATTPGDVQLRPS